MNRFACPHCHKKLKAPERSAGRMISCPKCGQSLVVPPPVQSTELVPLETAPIALNVPTESPSEIVFQPQAPVLIHFETPGQPSKTGPLLLTLLIIAILFLGVILIVVLNIPQKGSSVANRGKSPAIQPAPKQEDAEPQQHARPEQPAVPGPKQPAIANPEPKKNPPREREQVEEDIEKQLEKQRQRIEEEKKAKPNPVLELVGRLNHALTNHEQKETIAALKELEQLGQAGKPASRLVCVAVLEKSREVSQAALEALVKVNPQIAAHVITLRVDQNPEKRAEAISAIAEMGDEGKAAVPVMVRYVSDRLPLAPGRIVGSSDIVVVPPGQLVVITHGPNAAPSFRMNSTDESEAKVAVSALARVSPDDSEARTMLISVSDFKGSEELRSQAITLLGDIGQASTRKVREQLLPALQKRLEKDDRSCLIPTLEALAKFCSDAKPAEKSVIA
jgi:hypothetical protein